MKFIKSALSQTAARSLMATTSAFVFCLATTGDSAAAQALTPEPFQILDYPGVVAKHPRQISHDPFSGDYLAVRTRPFLADAPLDEAYRSSPSAPTRWYPLIADFLEKSPAAQVAAVVPAPDHTYTLLNKELDGPSGAWIVRRNRGSFPDGQTLQRLRIDSQIGEEPVEVIDALYASDRLYVLTRGTLNLWVEAINVLTAIDSSGNLLWSRSIAIGDGNTLSGMSFGWGAIYLTGSTLIGETSPGHPLLVRVNLNGVATAARVYTNIFTPVFGKQPRIVHGFGTLPQLVANDVNWNPIVAQLHPYNLTTIFSGRSISGPLVQGAYLRDAAMTNASALHLLFGSELGSAYGPLGHVLLTGRGSQHDPGLGSPATIYAFDHGVAPEGSYLVQSGLTVAVAGTTPAQLFSPRLLRLCHSSANGTSYPCAFGDTELTSSFSHLEHQPVQFSSFPVGSTLTEEPTLHGPDQILQTPDTVCD